MKKLVTMMLSVMLFMTAMITNVAADNFAPINPVDGMYLIEINQEDAGAPGDSYEYSAYRIFKGTPSNNGTANYLSDIEWDSASINVEALKADLMATFPSQFPNTMASSSAADFAAKMDYVTRKELLSSVIARNIKGTGTRIDHLHKYTSETKTGWTVVASVNDPHQINWDLSTVPEGTVTTGYETIADLGGTWTAGDHVGYKSYVEAGYYLIVNDVTPTNAAASRYIIQIVDNLKIEPKPMSAPTFNKQVVRQNDAVNAKEEPYKTTDNVSVDTLMTRYPNWYATADYDIGDDVVYRLSISLPGKETFEQIHDYRIEVHDDMSEGLTFTDGSLLIYYGYSETGTYHYYQVIADQIVSKTAYEAIQGSKNQPVTASFIENMEVVYPEKYKNTESGHRYLSCETEHENGHSTDPTSDCFSDLVADTTLMSEDMIHDYVETHMWYEAKASSDVYAKGTSLTIGSDSINHMVSKIGTIPEHITGHIQIIYACTLNEDAKVGIDENRSVDEKGSNGNPNMAYLQFSQSNESFDGETPKVINEVYTYQLTINKTDENKVALKGADFELLKYYKQITKPEVGMKYYTSNGNRKHPDNTNVTPLVVTADDLDTALNEVWLVVDPKEANANLDKDKFDYVGLDSGVYLLRELVAPTGYNKITAPVEFEIVATHNNDTTNPKFGTLTVTKISGPFNFSTNEGEGVVSSNAKLSATVVNKQGVQLPSTGGVGTTIFYIGGVALIVAAATLLIAKKKISD